MSAPSTIHDQPGDDNGQNWRRLVVQKTSKNIWLHTTGDRQGRTMDDLSIAIPHGRAREIAQWILDQTEES